MDEKNLKPTLRTASGRKSRAGQSIKKVNLELLNKKNMTILEREINELLKESYFGRLDPKGSDSLVKYITLVNELRALKELDNLEKEGEPNDS